MNFEGISKKFRGLRVGVRVEEALCF